MKILTAVLMLTAFSAILSSTKRDDKNTKYEKEAERYIQFARLPYCNPENLQSGGCPLCPTFQKVGFQIFNVTSASNEGINYVMVISTNGVGEVVVSFGGPKTTDV